MRRFVFLVAVAATAVGLPVASSADATVRTGVVVGVSRGDVLDVRLSDGTRERVRLAGVSAPGAGSCFSRRSAAAARRLAIGRRVALTRRGTSAYADLSRGGDLGRLLLAEGALQIAGSAFDRFASYVPAQRAADAENRGLWGACAADLAVGVTGPGQAVVGERVEYAATVRNRGPLAAPRVTLELRPSRSSTLLSAAAPGGACTMTTWLAVCSFGAVKPGAIVRATLVVRAERPGSTFARAAARFEWCLRARCGTAPVHDAETANDEKIALTLVGARSLAAGSAGRAAPGPDIRPLDEVRFVSVCGFSHRAPDDPIAFPGAHGRSHDHTFFGNVSTGADSTVSSLRAAQTTCQRSGDTAAYWAPTLVQDGKVIVPLDAVVYYTRRTVAPVRAFPPGLQIIGGDQHAAAAQPPSVTWWDCGEGTARSAAVPTCSAARRLRLAVRFPDCWNGRDLATGLHLTHMTYSSRGACPRTHPVAVPSISVFVTYPTSGGRALGLASGGQLTGHADFVNGWQQAELEQLVTRCLNALRVCGRTL